MSAPFRLDHFVAEAFRVPAPIAASTWAEESLRLPAESNAVAGRLQLTSYQRQMIDLANDPAVHTAIFQLASQIGKSLSIDALLAHWIVNDPGPALLVHPSEGKAKDYVRTRLEPLIAASPALGSAMRVGHGGRGQNAAFKRFEGGSVSIASAWKPDDLAARSIRYALFDEIERFPASAGREGDPVALGVKRTHQFSLNKKVIISSTPTIKGGRIVQHFERGDQKRFVVPCPACGTFEPLSFDMLKWTPGKPNDARLVCQHCPETWDNTARIAAVDKGHWNATVLDHEPGVISFHANVLISPFVTLSDIAADAEDAKKSPAKWRVFVNTSLAEDHAEAESEPLDAEILMARAEKIAAPFPADILFLTLGCDVQVRRLEYTILAHMKAGVGSVLHHGQIEGDTSGNTPWDALDLILGEGYRLKDGRTVLIEASAVDSGFSATRVYDFVQAQRRKQRRCFAVKGVGGFDKPVIRDGSRAKGTGPRVKLIGVDVVKLNVQTRLRMTEFGPGWLALPDHLGREYFEGLCAERMTVRQVKGYDRREFVRTDRLNEALDSPVYATAIAAEVRTPQATAKPAPSMASIADRFAALQGNP